jgi:uncharacterized protein DUF3617
MMQSHAGGSNAQRECSKRDVQRSGDSVTVDSTCAMGGKTLTSHAVIVGSFDSAYTMTVTSQAEGAPGAPVCNSRRDRRAKRRGLAGIHTVTRAPPRSCP